MILHTASEGITLSKQIESDSARFYESMAEHHKKYAEVFLNIAKENKKNIVQTQRVYFGVITDAIEGGYAFNLDTEKYVLKTDVTDGATDADVLDQAIGLEEIIVNFYTEAAEQSRSLMADVPRDFTLLAMKRSRRIESLKALAGK